MILKTAVGSSRTGRIRAVSLPLPKPGMMRALAGIILVAMWALIPVVAEPGRAWGAGPDWVLIDENDASSFYYDKAGITKPREGLIRVTARVVYTAEGKADTLELLKPAKGYENLFETRYLYDLDCKGWKSKLLRVTHFDKGGKQLKAFDLAEKTEWEGLLPNVRITEVAESECVR